MERTSLETASHRLFAPGVGMITITSIVSLMLAEQSSRERQSDGVPSSPTATLRLEEQHSQPPAAPFQDVISEHTKDSKPQSPP